MIRYIFSDMDGTVLDTKKNISLGNETIIRAARNAGAKFVFCSGRTFRDCEGYMEQLGIFGNEDDYFIGANGAGIWNGRGEILYSNPIPKTISKEFLDLLSREKVSVMLFNEEKPEIYSPPEIQRWKHSKPVSEIGEAQDLLCYKITTIFHDEEGKDAIFRIIDHFGRELFELSAAVPENIEINMAGVSKGNAILKLCEMTGTSVDEVLTIGDGWNDISMLRLTKYSGCPKNVFGDVYKEANYISPFTNDEDAVADIICHYLFQK